MSQGVSEEPPAKPAGDAGTGGERSKGTRAPKPGPRDDQDEIRRFDYLKTQLSYFVSHLQLADAKAGGIIIFSAAIARETGLALQLTNLDILANYIYVGLLGLVAALFSILFAFVAIWPRTGVGRLHVGGVQADVFSWMGVAAHGQNASYVPRALGAEQQEVLEGLADTTGSLALVIARKYRFIKMAFYALAPATGLSIVYWVLA
jgi:hypothetical protein